MPISSYANCRHLKMKNLRLRLGGLLSFDRSNGILVSATQPPLAAYPHRDQQMVVSRVRDSEILLLEFEIINKIRFI